MKKLFVVFALCVLLVTPALAEEPINGTIDVISIQIYEGNPAPPCDMLVTLNTCNNQGPYMLPATADGDLINEALLEAHLAPVPVDVGLDITLDDTVDPPTFSLEIATVQFGPGNLCP